MRTTPARISWERVGLAAVGIATPVALGGMLEPLLTGAAVAGTLAAMGAMVGSITDVGEAGAQRVERVALTSAMAVKGFALGTFVFGHPFLTFAAVVLGALVSGLAGTISAVASKAGLYFLVYLVIAANADFGLAPVWLAPVAFAAGAAWRLLLTVFAAAVTGVTLSPERRAVAHVYTALADQLELADSARAARASDGLTRALNDAYDVLVAAETSLVERDARWQRLVAVLNAAAPVVDAAIAMTAAGRRADAATVAWVRGIADWVRSPVSSQLPPAPAPARTIAIEEAALAASVSRACRLLREIDTEDRESLLGERLLPEKPSLATMLREAERSLSSGSDRWLAVVRLVLCMAVAQGLSLALQLERPYLVMLTVAQVMKPELGSVFARAVQRGAGTVIGVGIGSVAIALIPPGGWQVLAVFVFAAAIPIVMPRNYGLYAVVSTPLAVMLVEMHAGVHRELVESRLLDTVLGCVIVLLVGYLIWPSTWRAPRRLADGVAALARTVAQYVGVAFAPVFSDDAVRARAIARRSTYRSISDLRGRVAQALAEPSAVSAAAAGWLPVIAALERVTDAATAAATNVEVSGVAPERRDVAMVQSSLDDLAQSMQHSRPPGATPVPTAGVLAGVGDEITSAHAAASARLEAVSRRRRMRAGTARR